MEFQIQNSASLGGAWAVWCWFVILTTSVSAQMGSTLGEDTCITGRGDQSVGVHAYYDETCDMAGLGCWPGRLCRFCKKTVTPQSRFFTDCPEAPVPAPTPDTVTASVPSPTFSNPVPMPAFSEYSSVAASGDVIFYDDFTRLDLQKWKHEITMAGGGNWEFQLYRNNRTNTFVKDGVLHIKPTLTEDWLGGLGELNLNGMTAESDCTSSAFYGCERYNANPITSARINSRAFAFTTGRLEVHARLPRGDWLWPAIWLLPKYEQYGTWPMSGEIDVMEATGNAPGYAENRGVDTVQSVLHWGLDFSQNMYEKTKAEYKLPSGDFTQDFHTFGLVRTETGMYTYVDDDANRILEVSWANQTFWERGGWDNNTWNNPWAGAEQGAPFNEEFYLIINLAVGGVGFFPDGFGKPWTNDSQDAAGDFYSQKDTWYQTWKDNDSQFKIDWVKVTTL